MRSEHADWSPLWFEGDPTPGRVSEAKTLAASWKQIAQRLDAQAEYIGKQREHLVSPHWSGMAAEMFSQRLGVVADGFTQAAKKHTEAAHACDRWAADLKAAQSAADAALAEAVEAQKEIEAQEEALTSLTGGFVSAEAALAQLQKTSARYTGVTPPPGVTVPSEAQLRGARDQLRKVEEDLARCRRRLDSAQERLSSARAAAQQAQETYQRSERAFIDGVQAAMTGAPEWSKAGTQDFSTGMSAVALVDTADPLDALGRLTAKQWSALIQQNPELVWKLLGNPPSPDKVAAWWNRIKDTPKAQELISKAPWLLGNLDGIPFTVRDTCNREMLKRAVKDPTSVYKLLDPKHRPSLDEFVKQVTGLANALRNADDYATHLPGDPANKVAQLVLFGVFNQAVTGAICLGNLDTATNVTVNVPGATANITDTMDEYVRGDLDLIKAAYKQHDGSYAMVTWIGYATPGGPQAGIGDWARDGAKPLAGFLDGIHAARPGNLPQHVTVTGHSYGSTTVAEALTQVRYPVDDFISYGSVGFENGTTPAGMKVTHVYATEAANDGTADLGRGLTFGNRTDPREIPGVTVFPSDGVPGAKDVGGHDYYPTIPDPTDPEPDPAKKRRIPDPSKTGYISPGSAGQKETAKIIADGKLK